MRGFIKNLARPHDRRGDSEIGGEHPGLLLQRYLSQNATGEGGNPDEKLAIMSAAISAASKISALYRNAYERWTRSFDDSPSLVTCSQIAQTDGRVIVGLGSESVLETGIRLHHTYGMPILPGSAIKGLAAHYCHQVWGGVDNEYHEGNRLHKLLFGASDDSGCIRFLDAWLTPDSPSPLRVDVVTPHHPDWVDGKKAPSDFDSPVPVPFLSVSGKFQIVVQWQGPESEHAKNWTQRALELVLFALDEWGIGGKTSSGYGRLVNPATCPTAPRADTATNAAASRAIPKPGDQVNAILLAEKTKKGGWNAKHIQSGLQGPIHNSGDVPSDKEAGNALDLIVASANQHTIAFRYATATDSVRKEKAAKQNKGVKRR